MHRNQQASNASIQVAIDFLATLFATSASKRFFIGSRPNDKAEHIDTPFEEKFINRPRNAEQLPEFLREWDRPGRAMFFCCGVLKDNATLRQKLKIAESCALHADIDLDKLEGVDTVDDLIAKLMALDCPPSMIVASGHGCHAYWIFKAAIASSQTKRIERALKLLADLVGADRQPTHIAAFLRLPGSHNTKRGQWLEVRIAERNARRYEIGALEQWLRKTAPIVSRKADPRRVKAGAAGNAWQEFGAQHKKPIDIMQRLADMIYGGGDINGVHPTQLAVTSSMVGQGYSIPEIVKTVMAATRIAAGPYGTHWNWTEEERDIRRMITDWVKKVEAKDEAPPEIIEASTDQEDEQDGEQDDAGDNSAGADDDQEDDRAPSLSEEKIALNFAARHAERLRHVVFWGHWLLWDGSRWVKDETAKAFNLVRRICRETSRQAAKPKDGRLIASAKTAAAVERLAKANSRIAAAADQFDAQPMLFNLETQGTIELSSGEVRTPWQADYLTQQAGCDLAPIGTRHPLWTKFLKRVTDNNAELIAFLQRYIGYCLSGDVSEHVLVFAHGGGANGKSTFIGTIQKVFGDYAAIADMATFLASSHDRHPTEIAKLRGARLVIATETQAGRTWDEAKIKSITGGERLTARFMRQDFFEFDPSFKLFISGNHRPRIRSVDEAIRRRLLLIPFTVQIPKAERDPKLLEKLWDERAAILRWCLDGCLEWQRIGLAPPKIVTDATDGYFTDEDSLGAWLEDFCEVKLGSNMLWEQTGKLFNSWLAYTERNGDPAGTKKSFSEALTGRGFVACKKGNPRARAFSGLKLRPTNPYQGFSQATGPKPKKRA